MGRIPAAVIAETPRFFFYRLQWLWDFAFWLVARFGPTRAVAQALLTSTGRRGLLRLIRSIEPDVIVSTYPGTTEILGRLRRRGCVAVPVCGVITDLAAMRYWAARGIDLHLVTHPESIEEVRQVAGSETRVDCVHGLTAPEFIEARDSLAARRALGLPANGKIVLISGGGWGVGDLGGAVEASLTLEEVAEVVCLCARNEHLRARLQRSHGANPRVRVEGFTDQMGDWLAAGDALVHSTAGLTVLEAHMRGCPTVSYGWGRGHIRLNNAAFRRFGLADIVTSHADLADAVRRALQERKPLDLSFATLPSAASLVLGLAGTHE
jgi:UDP-N-acetylglucosamine:LPS N-acetylglucosamine transferase